MKRKVLRDYQKKVFQFGLKVDNPALFLEMRLGKTLISIRILKALKKKKGIYNILVIAPMGALHGWMTELKDSKIRKYLLIGKKDHRESILQSKYNIKDNKQRYFLINKEGVMVLPEIADYFWDAIIADESTFLKSPTKKTKNKRITISEFVRNNFKSKKRIVLTGTPNPQSDLDFYGQLKFLDRDIIPFDNYWQFRFSWFNEYGFNYVLNKQGKIGLGKVLESNCYFLTRKEAGLKEKKTRVIRTVELTPKIRKVYQKIEDYFMLSDTDENILKDTKYTLEKTLWLERLFGGFIDGEYVYSGKYNELKSLLSGELKGQSVVVWCTFRDELDLLISKFKNKSAMINGDTEFSERKRIIDSFQKGKIKYLFAQPQTMKYGIDLSMASTAIYYSNPRGFETRKQTEDRIISMVKGNVLLIDIITRDTMEYNFIEATIKNEGRIDTLKKLWKDRREK